MAVNPGAVAGTTGIMGPLNTAGISQLSRVTVINATQLQAAITAADRPTVITVLPDPTHAQGSYIISDTINMQDKTHVKIVGDVLIAPTGTPTNKPLLSMLGCENCTIEGLRFYASYDAELACGILMGRTSSASAGHNALRRVNIEGLFRGAALINAGSEVAVYDQCLFSNQATVSGGASVVHLKDGAPSYTVTPPAGAITAESCVGHTFRDCTFERSTQASNSEHDPEDDYIRIESAATATGNAIFDNCWFASGPTVKLTDRTKAGKAHIRLKQSATGNVYSIHCRNSASETYGMKSVIWASGTATVMKGVYLVGNTWGTTERYLVAESGVTCTKWVCDDHWITYKGNYNWAYTSNGTTFETADAARRRCLVDVDTVKDCTFDLSSDVIDMYRDNDTIPSAANRTVGSSSDYYAWAAGRVRTSCRRSEFYSVNGSDWQYGTGTENGVIRPPSIKQKGEDRMSVAAGRASMTASGFLTLGAQMAADSGFSIGEDCSLVELNAVIVCASKTGTDNVTVSLQTAGVDISGATCTVNVTATGTWYASLSVPPGMIKINDGTSIEMYVTFGGGLSAFSFVVRAVAVFARGQSAA